SLDTGAGFTRVDMVDYDEVLPADRVDHATSQCDSLEAVVIEEEIMMAFAAQMAAQGDRRVLSRLATFDREERVRAPGEEVVSGGAATVLKLARVDDPVHRVRAECERAAVGVPVHPPGVTEADREVRLLVVCALGLAPAAAAEDVPGVVGLDQFVRRGAFGAIGRDVIRQRGTQSLRGSARGVAGGGD